MSTPLPSPPRRRPWLWFVGFLLLALVVGSVWKKVLRYQAANELRAAGFWPGTDDLLELVRYREWRILFTYRAWETNRNVVWIGDTGQPIRNFDAFRPALRRLKIEAIRMHNSYTLENLSGLDDLPALKKLTFYNCTLHSVDGLKKVPALRRLYLMQCESLRNVDGLKSLSVLESLSLESCITLENLSGLYGLKTLKEINLSGSKKLSPESVAALRSALPNTHIIGPDSQVEDPFRYDSQDWWR